MLVIPEDTYNQLVIFPYNNRDLHVGNTWRNKWVGLSSPHCSRNSWEKILRTSTWKVKVINDKHNVWKWKWLMWASTRTSPLLVKEATIEPYTLIQCMIYTHCCIFGLAYLDDGHVPLHDGQGHLPLLLGVLLHSRVHDQKTTYDYVVVQLKILETGEKADNKTSRHLILSQGR